MSAAVAHAGIAHFEAMSAAKAGVEGELGTRALLPTWCGGSHASYARTPKLPC